jgi:DNA polymerase elongation subunit (family B)
MNDEGKLARRMSPWGVIDERTFVFKGKESTVKMLKGVAILDYLALYRKFTYSDVESYALNHIAHIELGEKKVDYSEYESLMELYRSDFQKFIVYNIHDVTLVNRLDEKMKLLDQVFAIAYDAKVNFVDALTTVRMWDMIIHNHLLDKNIVVPLAPTGETLVEKDEPIQGAYVKDPKPGMYKWVVSFDLTSLYPSLIMQYNISPETKANKIDLTPEDCLESTDRYQEGFDTAKQHSLTLCANGTMYRKDVKGFLPELMEKVFADRKKYKNLMLEAKALFEKTGDFEHEKKYVQYNNMQMAKKIQLNSCYGALSNVWFRFFDTDLAEAITLSGQVSIRWMQDRINKFMNKSLQTTDIDYVIAVDTDSLYITLDKFVEKVYGNKLPDRDKIIRMVDKACEEVFQPYIEKHYEDLGKHMLVYSQRMQMKRESIADKGIWVAKKRYILNVFNEEGVQYEKPKLKMKGIEAVKSSTPAVVKVAIKEALYILMNGSKDEFYQYVDSFKERFDEMPFEDVASPRSCQGVSKHKLGGKSIPIHVRGALVYNHNINKLNITNTYTPIQDGDKIKFSYLRIPNPLSTNVISAPGALPKQLNIDRYVDHDTQFSKTFTEPVNGIINNIGWSIGKQQTLEDLFG